MSTPAKDLARQCAAMAMELRRYRAEQGASEEDMAALLGVTLEFYRRCEADDGGELKFSSMQRYCNTFPVNERPFALARLIGVPVPERD